MIIMFQLYTGTRILQSNEKELHFLETSLRRDETESKETLTNHPTVTIVIVRKVVPGFSVIHCISTHPAPSPSVYFTAHVNIRFYAFFVCVNLFVSIVL